MWVFEFKNACIMNFLAFFSARKRVCIDDDNECDVTAGEFANQIKSFLLVYEAVKTTINDQVGGGGIREGSFWCVLFTWVDVC